MRWTNDSLPRQSCPKDDIIRLYNKMTLNERPSPMFKQTFRCTHVLILRNQFFTPILYFTSVVP